MNKESEERMLKVIEEMPASRLAGMDVAARLAHAAGRQQGQVVSGGYVGYWETVKGEVQIVSVTRSSETLEDYK